MASKIVVPEGFTVVLFADAKQAEGESGVLSGKSKKNGTTVRIRNLFVPFPKPEHIVQAVAGVRHVLTDVEGNKHEYAGVHACSASKWWHGMEYLRGLVREGRDEGFIRNRATAFLSLVGSERSGSAAVWSGAQFDANAAEAVKASKGDLQKAMAWLKAKAAADGVVV